MFPNQPGPMEVSVILLLLAMIAAIIMITLGLYRYLFSARLRNYASAMDIAVVAKRKRSQIENNLYSIISDKVTKIGKPFIEKYTATSKTHRILYLVGATCALACTVLLGLISLYEILDEYTPLFSAKLVASYAQGLRYAFTDLVLSLSTIVGVSFSFALVLSLLNYLIQRFVCVLKIHRSTIPKSDPEPADRADLIMLSLGIIMPISILLLFFLLSYYQGTYETQASWVTEHYEELHDIPLYETQYDTLYYLGEVMIDSGWAYTQQPTISFLKRSFPDLNEHSSAKRVLIISAFLDHFFDTQEPFHDNPQIDLLHAYTFLSLVDTELAYSLLQENYYQKHQDKRQKLSTIFDQQIASDYGSLFGLENY